MFAGQGPRPRLVGEALHLPVERRHGRSAPLTMRGKITLRLGRGESFTPRTPGLAESSRRAAGGASKLCCVKGF